MLLFDDVLFELLEKMFVILALFVDVEFVLAEELVCLEIKFKYNNI